MFRIQLVSALLALSLALAACTVTVTPPPPTPVPAVTAAIPAAVAIPAAAQPAVDAAIQFMAAERGMDATVISVVAAEAVEWSDSCLGIVRADTMCAQVITPGYRITLTAAGAEYVYHTNATGANIVAAQP